jgi:hypothetical protein
MKKFNPATLSALFASAARITVATPPPKASEADGWISQMVKTALTFHRKFSAATTTVHNRMRLRGP